MVEKIVYNIFQKKKIFICYKCFFLINLLIFQKYYIFIKRKKIYNKNKNIKNPIPLPQNQIYYF